MKKTTICTLVSIALVSSYVNAAEVYSDETTSIKVDGRIEVRGNISDANKSEFGDNAFKDASRVRLNIEGLEKVTDSVSLLARYEFEMSEIAPGQYDTNGINTRQLYAGVQTGFGTVTYGHQNNASTMLTDWTDLAETFSGYVNEYSVASADRANGVLAYRLGIDSKFDFAASINLDSEHQNGSIGSVNTKTGDVSEYTGYSATGSYAITDSISLGLGYMSSTQVEDSNSYSNSGLIAAKYKANGINLAAMLMSGEIADNGDTYGLYGSSDFTAYDLYAGYTFGKNNINLTRSYFDVDNEAFRDLNVDFIAVEYARYINNSSLYVSYKINQLGEDEGGILDNNENELQFGFRYMF